MEKTFEQIRAELKSATERWNAALSFRCRDAVEINAAREAVEFAGRAFCAALVASRSA